MWNGNDRKESGEKYGDEVCNILASELEMTEVRVLIIMFLVMDLFIKVSKKIKCPNPIGTK